MPNSPTHSTLRAGAPLLTVALAAGLIAAYPAFAFQDQNKEAAVTEAMAATSAEYFPAPSDTELKIQAQFVRPVEFNFIDTPLNSALEFIKEQHGINIILDAQSLKNEKIDPATPMTIQVSGITLKSALNLLFQDLKLTYYIEDDVLKVTTHAALAKKFVTLVYPFGELCRNSADYDILKEAIVKTVTPIAWVENGGDCALVPVVSSGALVIRASHPMHNDIQRLLRTLREARGRAAGPAK